MKKISISEAINSNISLELKSTKEELVLAWLIEFKNYLLKNKLAEYGDIMPSKKDISKYLKISTGTIQNAIKIAEDMGHFTSKQCIGTIISDIENKEKNIKMFSKKDKTVIEIKKYLINQGYEENEIIPTIIELASEIKTSTNTIRLAISELITNGFLRKENLNKKSVYMVNEKLKLSDKEKMPHSDIRNKNLVKILKENIKKYLQQNYKTGDKIPSNKFFTEYYKVSIRTINSAMKELNKEKIILSRRGNYGSIFLNTSLKEARSEKSMFMSKPQGKKDLKKNYNYKWEYAFDNIKKYILKNHEAGDKIPSMKDFAQRLNISVTTVKKAVHQLIQQGVLFTIKGKYGGLFIVELPQQEDSYTWLAINPDYFED